MYLNDVIIEQGLHPFGECPVLAFTESGTFPHVGNFAQIADLSRRYYNARSELDEILRAQTFSLMTYQIPAGGFTDMKTLANDVGATVGTQNMLIHEGVAPSFIAPSDGPATVYQSVLQGLTEAIGRISFSIQPSQTQAESGVALNIRFQDLNSALSAFAQRMQDLESRMWSIVTGYRGLSKAPTAQWETDYAIADTERELAVLAAMQSTGFPDEALTEQRKRIAGEVFDSLNEADLQYVMDAIDSAEVEPPIAPTGPLNPSNPNNPED